MKEPIAIVGLACRLPRVDNLQELWPFLLQKKSAVTDAPERIQWPEGIEFSGRYKALNKGCFLTGIDQLHAENFGIKPREASFMDPQQQILLELTWETIMDAAINPELLKGKDIGVYIGACNYDYRENLVKQLGNRLNIFFSTGTLVSFLANRISYQFDLRGPSKVIDTACSSSLVALNEAVQAISEDRIEAAIVGGISIICNGTNSLVYNQLGIISKSGIARSFSQHADGYVRGEGGVVLYLLPLSKALQERHNIYALIRGSETNHDGRTSSVSLPNHQAQADLLVKNLSRGGIDPNRINYFEAHAPGSPVGDKLEFEGIKLAFKRLGRTAEDSKCFISSLKGNIGHLEAAAGFSSLLKAILVLKKGLIPPINNFIELNSKISLANSCLEFVIETTKFPESSEPAMAVINSFGLGGTNSNLIVEAFKKEINHSSRDFSQQLFLFSSDNQENVTNQVKEVLQLLEKISSSDVQYFLDLAFTLQMRPAFKYRFAILADNLDNLKRKLKTQEEPISSENQKTALSKLAEFFLKGHQIEWSRLWKQENLLQVRRVRLPSSFKTKFRAEMSSMQLKGH